MKLLAWINHYVLRHFYVALVTKPDTESKKIVDGYLSTLHTKEWINEDSKSRDPGQKDTQKEARVKGEWAVTIHDTGDFEEQSGTDKGREEK
jgi:hypothetical protein